MSANVETAHPPWKELMEEVVAPDNIASSDEARGVKPRKPG